MLGKKELIHRKYHLNALISLVVGMSSQEGKYDTCVATCDTVGIEGRSAKKRVSGEENQYRWGK